MIVVRCGAAVVPSALSGVPVVEVPDRPVRSALGGVLGVVSTAASTSGSTAASTTTSTSTSGSGTGTGGGASDTGTHPGKADTRTVTPRPPRRSRVVVCGADADFAAVVTAFLRSDLLAGADDDPEFAFVASSATSTTRAYRLPVGDAAARLAAAGTAAELPLVRDDTGTVLVGEARITGPDGAPLVGEAYADDERVFSGEVPALSITPAPAMPGLLVTDGSRRGVLRRPRVLAARAVQLGTPGAIVVRDDVPGRRPVKRSSFYRHEHPWHLVRP